MKRKNRRTRIELMKREIEARGGIVGISNDAPDWITEQFLQSVLDCPDCQALAARHAKRHADH